MAAPATNGKLCTNLADMEIGDYIKCVYTAEEANVAGTFSHLGELHPTYMKDVTNEEGEVTGQELSEYEELPTTPAETANGYFYLLKADKGLLIADRLVQSSISWNSLNKAGYIYGKVEEVGGGQGLILLRSLSFNECIKYIVESTLNDNINLKDDNVWHANNLTTYDGKKYNYISSLIQDNEDSVTKTHNGFYTIIHENGGVTYANHREAYDGGFGATYNSLVVFVNKSDNFALVHTGTSWYGWIPGSSVNPSFRPAFNFINNNKSTNLFY